MRNRNPRQPRQVAATIPMVQRAFDQGDFSGALQLAQAVVLRQPLNHLALYHLGLVQSVIGQCAEAEQSLNKAISIKGDSALYWGQLGIALQSLNQVDRARDAFERCLALKPTHSGTFAAAAEFYIIVNELDRADELLSPLLSDPAPSPAVLCVAARVARVRRDPSRVLALLEARALDESMPVALRGSLLFHLAPLYELQGRYDEAFAAIELANSLRPRQFSPQQHSATIDELITAWDSDKFKSFARAQCQAGQSRVPVFIVGMPRSGTTLIEQMLSSHPRCFGAGETDLIGQCVVHHSAQYGIGDPQYLLTPGLLTERFLDETATKYLAFLSTFDADAARVIDKNPINYRHLGFIHLLYPNAKIIHCVRHPLDTGLSCYFHDFAGNIHFHSKLEHIGSCFADYVRLMDHWKHLFPEHIIDVQYEDLTKDPHANIRPVLDFVGLDWDDRILEFHKNSRVAMTASVHQVRRPIYHTAVGRWKRYKDHLRPLINTLQERGVEV